MDPGLLDVLRDLRRTVASVVLSLDLPGAADMRRERAEVLELLDGYLVRRLREPNRPLLVVIGGPTGAGKSTLLNSLVESEVSTPGVLRPTTRSPILVHHPSDADVAQRLLPSLTVSTRTASTHSSGAAVEVIAHAHATPGLLVLDSPDLDSWLASNRETAVGLLQLADIWVFVTTGTEYADGVPWELLRAAASKRVAIATVLNRLRPTETQRVPTHFARMLIAEQLRDTPVVHVPEVELVDDRIPATYVRPLRNWLERQTSSQHLRSGHIQRSIDGSLDQVAASVRSLVNASGDQVVASHRLRVDLDVAFTAAHDRLLERCGSADVTDVIRAGWPSADDADPGRGFDARRLRRRLTRTAAGGSEQATAVTDTLIKLLSDVAAEEVVAATIRVAERWASHPAAASFGIESLAATTTDLRQRSNDMVSHWLDIVAVQPAVVSRHGGFAQPTPGRWPMPVLAVAAAALIKPAGTSSQPPPQMSTQLNPTAIQSALDAPDMHEAITAAQNALRDGIQALMTTQRDRLAQRLDEGNMPPTIARDLRQQLQTLTALRQQTNRQQTNSHTDQHDTVANPGSVAPSWASAD